MHAQNFKYWKQFSSFKLVAIFIPLHSWYKKHENKISKEREALVRTLKLNVFDDGGNNEREYYACI